jgi:hypothetical protein
MSTGAASAITLMMMFCGGESSNMTASVSEVLDNRSLGLTSTNQSGNITTRSNLRGSLTNSGSHYQEGPPLCDAFFEPWHSFLGKTFALYNKNQGKYLSTDGHNVNLDHSLWQGSLWQLQYTPRGYYFVNVWQQKYMDSYHRTTHGEKDVHLWVGNGLDDQGKHPENHRWHFLEAEQAFPNQQDPCSWVIKHDASGEHLDAMFGNVKLYGPLSNTHNLQWELRPVDGRRL